MTRYRWVVCALLFFATTVNYVDRQVFGILGPDLTKEFGWSETDYSYIVMAFTLAYGISYALAGRMMDWLGERKGFTIAVTLWSIAAMAHGLVHPLVYTALPWLKTAMVGTFLGSLTPAVVSVAGFSLARFGLGMAEGGNFPGAVKTVGMWHPKSERAMATGIFNAGSNVGVIVAAFSVPLIVAKLKWDWPAAFYLTGALGFIWLVFWLVLYDRPERHPRVSAEELKHIQRDPPDPAVHISWFSLLKYRQTWACALGNFMISPVWWFYLYWTPKFLKNNFNVELENMFLPLVVIYLMADIGSIFGGAVSSWLIHRGATVNVARKTAFLACAALAIPMTFAPRVGNLWVAVFFLGLAAAADTGFSANLFTIVSDTVPRKVVGAVVGLQGTVGCIGGLILAQTVGWVLDWTEKVYGHKDYLIPYLIAGSAYFLTTAVIHLILPRLEPMSFESNNSPDSVNA